MGGAGTGGGGAGGSGPGAACGDGDIEGDEDCDDDNTTAGDGCDGSCNVENGWSCTAGNQPSTCSPTCGDALRVGAETAADRCDDDDIDPNDGCDATCHVEAGFMCTGTPSVCAALCGNGAIDGSEACDDGNTNAADGCTACAVDTHWSCTGTPSVCNADVDANVLISGLQLAALPTRKPSAIETGVTITGVTSNDTLMGIDRRPANGMLYGIGHNSKAGTVQLYLVSSETALATPIGTAAQFVQTDGTTAVPLAGTQFGFDFNPTVDRIRVVTNQSQNFRMNPNNGALVDGDTVNGGVQTDGAISGGTTTLDEVAYTNNSINQTATTLYTLDRVAGALFIQNPPNNGTQTSSVLLPADVNLVWGFDIAAGVDVATANTAATGSGYVVVTLDNATQSALARIDLATAAVSGVTEIGTNIVGLAVQNLDVVPMVGLTLGTPQQLVRFKSSDPNNPLAVNVTGTVTGETLVDIDFRPATGQLYGLGIDAATNTGTLYVVDPQTGVATAVGSASQVAFADTNGPIDLPADNLGWSIDFNPTVDRLRVVASTGLNFRANPITGGPVDSNTTTVGTIEPDTIVSGLTGGALGASGAAYTNSWGGATTTTLYVVDATANQVCYSSNPNGGVMTGCTAVTANSQPLDISTANEADFAADVRTATANVATTGALHTVMSVGGMAHLFSINIMTGVATDRGQIGAGTELVGFAVGHATVK